MLKNYSSLILLLMVTAPTLAQDKPLHIGHIDFYGYDGVDIKKIRAALPVHEGDVLAADSSARVKESIGQAVKRLTGHDPVEIAGVCCDKAHGVELYIGLPEGVASNSYNPAPAGSIRFPPEVITLYQKKSDAWSDAMRRGVFGENDSKGFALSSDPATRALQLALHDYVLQHEELVRRVLADARDVEHRQMAAEMLGYAQRSLEQVAALVHAASDPDDLVRNNAVRALGVMAHASPEALKAFPVSPFITMLNSASWTDRNKASLLFMSLTQSRDPQVLGALRAGALTSLIEMARWQSAGHADAARLILGRMAGLDEHTIHPLMSAGLVEDIIKAAQEPR